MLAACIVGLFAASIPVGLFAGLFIFASAFAVLPLLLQVHFSSLGAFGSVLRFGVSSAAGFLLFWVWLLVGCLLAISGPSFRLLVVGFLLVVLQVSPAVLVFDLGSCFPVFLPPSSPAERQVVASPV